MVLLPLAAFLAAELLNDPVEIVRRLATADRRNRELAREYTFVRRSEERELDRSGKVKKTESETFDVSFLYGRPYSKRIAKNDKPLASPEQAKEDEKLQKEASKRQREPENERRKQIEQDNKRREQFRELVDEITKAYSLTLEGTEKIDARTVYRVSGIPRDDYARRWPPYSWLKKMRGTMWIDSDEFQIVKIEADVIDTISVGWALARLSPGTRLRFEQARVNGEVWLPRVAEAKIDARFALLNKVRMEAATTWKNFRKFQTDSRVVDLTELR